jgi:hypothetical protein
MEKYNRAPKQYFSKGGKHTTESKQTVALVVREEI